MIGTSKSGGRTGLNVHDLVIVCRIVKIAPHTVLRLVTCYDSKRIDAHCAE